MNVNQTSKTTLTDMEQEFLNLINFFRKLSSFKDAGYAGDHGGFGYIDLVQGIDEPSDICLYCEDFTFRICKSTKKDSYGDFVVIINNDTHGDLKINTKDVKSVETLIMETLNIAIPEDTSFSKESLIQRLDEEIKPLLKTIPISSNIVYSKERNVFYSVYLNQFDLLRIRNTEHGFKIDLLTDHDVNSIGVPKHAGIQQLIKTTRNLIQSYAKVLI